MTDSFWTTTSQTPAVPVFEHNTPGDNKTNPVTLIRGADGGSASPTLTAEAAELFPIWDADGNVISSRPSTYAANVEGSEFARWNSAHQLAWMSEFGTNGTATDGTDTVNYKYASFGTSSNDAENYHFVLSADKSRLITLNYLQRHDIAILPLDDQRAIAAHPAYQATFAALYNMTPQGAQSIADARSDATAIISSAISSVQSSGSYVSGQEATFESDPSVRATQWPYLFTEQLQILQAEVEAMAIFDQDAIDLRVESILTRFERVERVSDMTAEASTTYAQAAVNALDGGTGIATAFDTLVEIEIELYDIAVARREIIEVGTYNGITLDAPGLTFVLQTLTNYQKEAEAEAETEDLNQRNALMEDYEVMQSLINDTLTEYSAAESGQTQTEKLTIANATTYADLSAENQRAVAMFDSYYSALLSNTYHPYETEKDIERPVEAILDSSDGSLNAYAKEVWDALGLNLSEATGTMSRDNQQVMDEVNELNSEKNRHYDLASSTLNKMTEVLRSIIN